MTPDHDDALGGRLDEDEVRLADTLAEHGLELRRPRKRPWEELELTSLPPLTTMVTRAHGAIDGGLVDVFEYETVASGDKPKTRPVVAIVLRHPSIQHAATLRSRAAETVPWYAWVLLSPILLLIAPFVFAFAYLEDRFRPKSAPSWVDDKTGDADFDRLAIVKVAKKGQAASAIPPGLRSALEPLVDNDFRAEMREGLFACTVPLPRLDARTALEVLPRARRILGALTGSFATTEPYRVSAPAASSGSSASRGAGAPDGSRATGVRVDVDDEAEEHEAAEDEEKDAATRGGR